MKNASSSLGSIGEEMMISQDKTTRDDVTCIDEGRQTGLEGDMYDCFILSMNDLVRIKP